jgi:hypothetical protein
VLKDGLWLNQSRHYVESIFGASSIQVAQFSEFQYHADLDPGHTIYGYNAREKREKDAIELRRIIESFIETVRNTGVVHVRKGNWLSKLSPGEMISLATSAIAIAFSAGIWVGSRDIKAMFPEKPAKEVPAKEKKINKY